MINGSAGIIVFRNTFVLHSLSLPHPTLLRYIHRMTSIATIKNDNKLKSSDEKPKRNGIRPSSDGRGDGSS